MTTTVIEEPLDRLNYFNGQRLEATDLRVEQAYHIRVRRQLNQALYTPGIASGLEVSPSANVHAVTVSPGVALDALGREVILLETTEVQVRGLPNTEPSWVYGNFLYILYEEEEVAATYGGCTSGKNQLAWGGPTRIRAIPLLAFADTWPNEKDGPIILAQVELGPGCEVAQIHNQARKYVDAARPTTRTVSYEGEKNLAKDHSKRLTFHVIGGPSSSATLYLWGDEFSSLHYTQLGAHEHKIPELETTVKEQQAHDLSHDHTIDLSPATTAQENPEHGHNLKLPVNEEATKEEAFKLAESADHTKWFLNLGTGEFKPEVTAGAHTHALTGEHPTMTATLSVPGGSHYHTTKARTDDGDAVTTGPTGQGVLIEAGPTARLTDLDDLRVWLDDTDITDQVLAQLGGPANGWEKLGDGTSAHKLHVDQGGTGAIALERIAALNQGEHTLEFMVENDTGGNLRYNLYVE
jgi:hypothetical protein